MAPAISIIVPTRNESRNLPRLLASIQMQIDTSFEVIVVDQESDDETVVIAEQRGATVISRERPAFYSPPSQSRNVGAQKASGELLVHLDADMELPDPQFLSRLASVINDDHQAAIIHETDVALGWWNKVKAAERDCYWNTPIECARAVRRSLFDEIGGYDPSISSGEDMHIQAMYVARTSVVARSDIWLRHHTGRIPLRRLLTKKFNYGKTSQAFLDGSSQAGGHSANSWVAESLKAYATHWDVAKKHPLAFACILPLRAMELIAVRLGMRTARKNA